MLGALLIDFEKAFDKVVIQTNKKRIPKSSYQINLEHDFRTLIHNN